MYFGFNTRILIEGNMASGLKDKAHKEKQNKLTLREKVRLRNKDEKSDKARTVKSKSLNLETHGRSSSLQSIDETGDELASRGSRGDLAQGGGGEVSPEKGASETSGAGAVAGVKLRDKTGSDKRKDKNRRSSSSSVIK